MDICLLWVLCVVRYVINKLSLLNPVGCLYYCTFILSITLAFEALPLRLLFNSLNSELNPICHLLALLGAHHILHVSRIRVKLSYECWQWESFSKEGKGRRVCILVHTLAHGF